MNHSGSGRRGECDAETNENAISHKWMKEEIGDVNKCEVGYNYFSCSKIRILSEDPNSGNFEVRNTPESELEPGPPKTDTLKRISFSLAVFIAFRSDILCICKLH